MIPAGQIRPRRRHQCDEAALQGGCETLPPSDPGQAFNFDGASVRTVVGENGDPWFVGKDIATALGYTNPQKAVRDHCKAPRPAGVNGSFTPRLDPQTVLVSEPDMLRLIVGSSLPSAERFERWVFEDVLPTIRKTGGYGAPTIDPMVALNDPATMRTRARGAAAA